MTAWWGLRAIVFDLDDTLYAQRDFKVSGLRAVAHWLADRNGSDPEPIFATLVAEMDRLGPSHPRILDQVFARPQLPGVDIAEAIDVFRRHRPQIELYPGVQTLLGELRSTWRIGLLTDGLAQVQRGKVEALGLAPRVDQLLFSAEIGTSKPDPRLFALLEQRFGLRPRQLAYVGDNPHKDFVGANARGWLTVRVRSGEYAADEVAAPHEAAVEIDTVRDLPRLLAASRRGSMSGR